MFISISDIVKKKIGVQIVLLIIIKSYIPLYKHIILLYCVNHSSVHLLHSWRCVSLLLRHQLQTSEADPVRDLRHRFRLFPLLWTCDFYEEMYASCHVERTLGQHRRFLLGKYFCLLQCMIDKKS